MANEPTIAQMDDLIGQFDGWEFLPGFASRLYKKNGITIADCDFQYHTSWSWLMPVWNKLRGELFACMPASGINDGFDKYGDAWKTACFNAEIETAHKVVYSAIQWLNQQKQKDGEG